ncbi:addiction module antidote protein, HigA family [Rhodophyticola sp. CCM32]|uniref:HigA family addiction module antitoxin n=1 Tax=Rhodophyticola sp. CCM32 TaxID=2916397 RepID=UPI00107FBA71|nr:HigA family addiction module antitoxin [Rhodophyticola sp. CCM32]QBY00127.1 addiction module antidote protein, HigA family [Rhodophyticola sp. CCM32]
MTKLRNRVHPGEIIKDEFVIPLALDVTTLAQDLGISIADFWDVLDGQRALTADLCRALGGRFRTTPEFWEHLQATYDAPVLDKKADDPAFANDLEAQLETITDAYASGDAHEIDQALQHVSSIRRMKKQGILDLLNDFDDPAEPD